MSFSSQGLTVEELIKELNKVKDKSVHVCIGGEDKETAWVTGFDIIFTDVVLSTT